MDGFTPRQLFIVLLIAAVQFVNILDFVIIMPLGPELAANLGFSDARVGFINGAYTGAAALAGLLGSLFLDRFDRRKALAVALLGLVTGTAAGGLARDFTTLLAARCVAGAFGGPATSLAFSIIADTIPTRLRGRAMGTVMGAFSVASVFGVPAGLWLGEQLSWRAPFYAVAGLGAAVAAGAIGLLPPMRDHLRAGAAPRPPSGAGKVAELLSRPLVQLSYAMTAVVMMAGFVLIPNIAPYLQLNLGLPREWLKYAYACGGVASFFTTQLGGRAVDRYGAFRVGSVGALLVSGVVFTVFFLPWAAITPALACLAFAAFMTANGLRNVSYNTLTTRVPEPEVRARFQSLQSAVQHGSAALAAFLSAGLLSSAGAPPRLAGMERVALVSMGLSLIIPLMLRAVERGVRAQRPAPLPGGLHAPS